MLKKFIICVVMIMSMMTDCFAEEEYTESSLSNSVNDFGWKYFSTLDKSENIFYSPYSIATALTVVANGAEGQTQEEMLNALFISSLEAVNSSYTSLQLQHRC